MLTSELISQCRREFQDIPKMSQAAKLADGVANVFNLGRQPIVESSYTIYFNTSAKTETTHYTLDKDSGDLQTVAVQAAGINVKAIFKYAIFRDANWTEAINYGIDALNGRGFFRQVVRNTSVMALSANVRTYSGPSACVDLYEVLQTDTGTVSGSYRRLEGNWSYQQDANKLLLDYKPLTAGKLAVSYLRNMQTYSATSATLDVAQDWLELVKTKAGVYFYDSLAARIAQMPTATVDEGHYSVRNLLALSQNLEQRFNQLAARKKPTRPAKSMQYAVSDGTR